MGAIENRCVNILMLFRFIVSSGMADFWADRNHMLTIEAFSYHFKCLFSLAAIAQEDLRAAVRRLAIALSASAYFGLEE